jgi:type II secretion system protein I
MRAQRKGTIAGFTFIEVLVAMLIFTLAALAAVDIGRGSVRATRDTRDVTRATWLLQSVMTELETKLETQGFEKGCVPKAEGKFEEPNQDFTWKTYCHEVDLRLSETAAQVARSLKEGEDDGGDIATRENVFQKMILNNASDYLTKALREIHAEVYWTQGKDTRKVEATTHVVRFDLPLPGAGGSPIPGGGGAAPAPIPVGGGNPF